MKGRLALHGFPASYFVKGDGEVSEFGVQDTIAESGVEGDKEAYGCE